MPGIISSRNTRSKAVALDQGMASSPLVAVSTAYPFSQEDDVRPEQLDLVVDPENPSLALPWTFLSRRMCENTSNRLDE